ncbi:MAG: hypothetical protein ACXABV_10265 [Candidatus Thorarchaeota archaeon]|jgi:hypothetical protein
MGEVFKLYLHEIQPSQLYINKAKLDAVINGRNLGELSMYEPIPIKEIDGELVSTDGHTRGVAWLLEGYEEVEVEWETFDLDWEAYAICVQWCKDEGINSISDLKDRVIDHSEYEVLWYERCRVMQKELEEKRKKSSKESL